MKEEILKEIIERYPEFNTGSIAFFSTILSKYEKLLIDQIKKEMYEMQAVKQIDFTDGKTGATERLEVLTKYQVANLLNAYEHTYLHEKSA